jgi:hypothetical protein
VRPINPDDPRLSDQGARGVRYYEPRAFLMAYPDPEGGIKCEWVTLPDTTKKQSALAYTLLASNEISLEFDRGILTKGSADIDQTIVPAAIVSAVGKYLSGRIATKATGPGDPQVKFGQLPEPYLFRLEFDKDVARLVRCEIEGTP